MNNLTQNHFGMKVRGELRYQEPMQRHTSWRAGGCAQRAYVPADVADLSRFLRSNPQDELIHVEKVQRVVKKQQGIYLEREVRIVGDLA
ncbi:MAG: hypothetical protein ABIP64_04215 [Burkholderiales bacterium]